MAYARLDRRLVIRLVTDLLFNTDSADVLTYAPGEQPEPDPTRPVAQLVAVDYDDDRATGGGDTPDHASITVTVNCWVKRAIYAVDAFSLETAISRVEQQMSNKTASEGVHTVSLGGASVSFDTDPDPASHARSAAITIPGVACRASGATLEGA